MVQRPEMAGKRKKIANLEFRKKKNGQWKFRYAGEDEFSSAIMATSTKFIDASRRATLWVLKFIKLILKEEITWLQSMSTDKDRMAKANYDVTEWILIKQAR
ncbi:unnamed protein product [Dracunculus medinensis]|uniref:Integrase n=1 Tax=Dracunculus medinensis TaxID=318479 RepID=A0A0N4UI65_DRAME|nr:unnamed protein product [Dracunculus medinensis]